MYSTDSVPAEPPFDFAQIRRSAYELLARLLMDFEHGQPDENVRYNAPISALTRLSELVEANLFTGPGLPRNPFGDGRTFERPTLPVTVGVFGIDPDTGEDIIIQESAPADDIRVRASRLSSDRDAFALQRLWEVATSLQIYFGFAPSIGSAATDEPMRIASSPRGQGERLPSDIIPRLQEAIRLLNEQRPVSARPAFETWLTILSELDKEFPSFRPTIECNPGPCISERWAGVVTGYSGTTPIIREKPETQAFRPLRRLASGLVPLLESMGISLPDDAGSTPDGRLLFWAWHIHKGTPPTLPSWEVELEKVLPELGAFSVIKSAILASVNPDGSAKLNSPSPIRKLVTIQQVAKRIFHIGAGSMTPYVKDWGEPVIRYSGQTKAKYDLEVIRPTLKKQRPLAKDDEWKALEADATES